MNHINEGNMQPQETIVAHLSTQGYTLAFM